MLYLRYKFIRYNLLNILLGVLIIFTAIGCGSSATQQQTSEGTGTDTKEIANFSAPLPTELARHLVTGSVLSAQVIIDKGSASQKIIDLNVDVAGNKVSGTIGDLKAGTHSFDIVYYISSGGTKVEVASSTKNIVVAAGTTTPVTFAPSDLRYIDTDRDGFTNLTELESGTGWNDASLRPKAELPRSSSNYVLSDTMGVSPTDGKTTVVGESKSADYTLY